MDLTQIAAKLFLDKVNAGGLDVSTVTTALKGLLPTSGSDIDIGALVTKFTSQGGGIASMAASWLGDGGNQNISADSIKDIFGENKVSEFANTLGMSTDKAASGLSDAIPELIDKGSEGGSLVQNVAASLGKKFLGGLF